MHSYLLNDFSLMKILAIFAYVDVSGFNSQNNSGILFIKDNKVKDILEAFCVKNCFGVKEWIIKKKGREGEWNYRK